jgi:glycosyltransferase involved in cell wall biosynthesis
MKSPLISVGLQFFNNERTIGRCIEAILAQTHQNFELIIHDDGSTDGGLNIVQQFRDPRIRLFSDGENRKRPYRLNQSIQIARGKYYAVVDGDDVSFPNRLEVQLSYMESHEELDLIGGGMLVIDRQGVALGKRLPPETHREICSKRFGGIQMSQPTFFGKTQWFQQHQYDLDVPLSEDQYLLLRTSNNSRFGNVQEIVVAYEEVGLKMQRVIDLRYWYLFGMARVHSNNGKYFKIIPIVLVEMLKLIGDFVAIRSGLGYSLTRHRAMPICRKDRYNWSRIRTQTDLTVYGISYASSIQHRAPIVSIGIQFYNNRRTIGRAIRGALHQTFTDFELIVHDDGSSDGGLPLQEAADCRISYYIKSDNKGRAYRLNESILLARGKYYAIMDGDDVSFPFRVETQVSFLEANPDVDLVGAGMIVLDEIGRPVGVRLPPVNHSHIIASYWQGVKMCQPTFMARTDWIRCYMYRACIRRAQDQDLLLSARLESRYANINMVLVGYEERRLSLKRLSIDRLHFLRVLFDRILFSDGLFLFLCSFGVQCVKWLVDCVAIITGLRYRLLRHRAGKLSSAEIDYYSALLNMQDVSFLRNAGSKDEG